MSVESIDQLSLILYTGIMFISGFFSVIIGIILVIISNKMKKEGKKDHKTWFYISIYCFAAGGFMLAVGVLFALLPAFFFPNT